MPREVVQIDLAQPGYLGMARFLSVLAFPENAGKRQIFCNAVARHFLSFLATKPRTSNVLIAINTSVFLGSDETANRVYRTGIKRLHECFLVGANIVLPKFHNDRELSEGFELSVTNLIELLVRDLNWKNTAGGSGATAKTKIWKPTWPVFHAAAGFTRFCCVNISSIVWESQPIHFEELIWVLMLDSDILKELIPFAEEVRCDALEKKYFKKIDEQSTIRFELINASQAKVWIGI